MARVLRLLVGLLLTSFIIASTAAAQSGSDLFQQALRKERVDGDVGDAIALYQRILRDFAADRALSAKVLVQLGEAHERQGNASARAAYQRVLNEFSEQTEQAALARARLAGLTTTTVSRSTEPTLRRIWSDAENVGGVSRDGRVVAFTSRQTGQLGVRDLVSGESRFLTPAPTQAWQAYAVGSMPSPDGQRIAYMWNDPKQPVELRVIGVRGGEPRTLYATPDVEYIAPMDWTVDGKRLLVFMLRKDRVGEIAMMSVTDGRPDVVKTVAWRGSPGQMSLSPDGRYVVYSVSRRTDSDERDLMVMSTDGAQDLVFVASASDERALGWTPDGGHVLYATGAIGQRSLWLAPVREGRLFGDPVVVRRDGDNVQPIGFVEGGSYAYLTSTPPLMRTAFAALDSNGVVTTPMTLAKLDRIDAWAAQWSRDGQSLAYVSNTPADPSYKAQIIVRNAQTGAERVIPASGLSYAYAVRWALDNSYLMVTGQDRAGRRGVFRVEPTTGAVTLVIPVPAAAEEGFAGWSADGQSVIHTGTDPRDARTFGVILQRHLVTGEERTVLRVNAGPVLQPKMAPDGRELAFVERQPAGSGGAAIHVASLARGEPRELVRAPAGSSIGSFAWSPDGRYVFYVLASTADQSGARRVTRKVLRVASSGGAPTETGLTLDGGAVAMQLHPDGRQVLFTLGEGATGRRDVWLMENFLPASARR